MARGPIASALLGAFVLCLLGTAVEVGSSTEAEAQAGCSCPAGYEVGFSGGVAFCFQPVSGGNTVNCGSGTPAPGNPRTGRVPPGPYSYPPIEDVPFDSDWGRTPFEFLVNFGFGNLGSHLGMYVSPSGTDGVGGFGDGFGLSGKSVGISDTSGAFAGATTPGFHGSGGGGGINGYIDVTPQLRVGGSFDYQHVSADFDGGSSQGFDSYAFKGYSTYRWLDSYVTGSILYDYMPTKFFDAGTGGTGNFNANLFDGDVSVGHVFVLIDPRGAGSHAILAKAPPQSSVIQNGLLLELSGHGGYVTGMDDGFTESTGFVWGDGHVHYGDLGIKAELQGVIPANGVIWLPYVTGTVDQLVGFSQTLDIPTQVAMAADTLTFDEATTWLGGEAGVETQVASGWTIGAKIFDTTSSDFNIVGGTGYVKVHF
jgi:Autotransporter beta-domain